MNGPAFITIRIKSVPKGDSLVPAAARTYLVGARVPAIAGRVPDGNGRSARSRRRFYVPWLAVLTALTIRKADAQNLFPELFTDSHPKEQVLTLGPDEVMVVRSRKKHCV